ncbi:hypothetical protein BCR44DRAFT_1447540 [Catenaria anguillulae PL171]|uniref:Uncharacterized protein n=1 Tax=Catenaria anguillulae PL171 TaxID=765915 RepID=A0A1Y2H9V3_9FUNG|nr:hypothetical protein BCR44DRAFT_1447540 [Catenaria anguillulae PL171]
MQRITSFTLIVHDEEHDSAFATLCGDLFRAYPHIRTLDIVSKFEYHYSFPAEFPSRAQHVAVYPYSRGSWEEHYDTLPMALFRTDLRHLEVYGSHSFIFKHWQHVFNHPTLTSLVTEFTYNSADQDPQRLSDFSAPALTSWTTNHGFAYVVFNDDLLPPIDQPIFTALQELALVYADWEYHSAMSIPKGYSQVPEIPFGRLPTLRKFSVLGKHSGEYVWINMKAKVLIDLLSLPNIHHLSLPNVSPYFVTPLAPTSIYCHSLTTLDINVNMFVDMLPSVVLPNITSLTLHTTYFPEPEHQLSPAMWQQIHDRWGTQLVHFGYRRIGFELETSPTCTFPTDLAFSNLHSIDMFTCIGTVDLMHVAAFAPNLNKAKIDADHAANLPALLAHPKLTHLELAGPRCPTMLEALLAHPPPKTLGLSLIPRAVTNLYGEHSSAIGHVCERTSVTLTYDRDHNWNVWRTLLRSENLGKLRHWVIRKGDNDMGDGDSDGYVENEWHATLVVHADLGPREARNIGRVVGQVLGEWDAVKVQVGVKDCAGHSEPTFLERLSEAVNEEHPSASVEWVGAITGEHDGWAVCGCDEK